MDEVSSPGDVVAVVALLGGTFLCLTAGLGLVRFPDVLTRMHAGTKPQTLGVLLIMIGGAIRLQGWSATWMLLLVAAFQLLTAPVTAHMISRVAYRRRHVRRDLLLIDELRTGDSLDRVYRGDEPADAPPEEPARSMREATQEPSVEDGRTRPARPPPRVATAAGRG
jgi:multicomponent Na+:H+ antiporter subunit G